MELPKKLYTQDFNDNDPGVEIFVPSPIGDVLNAILDERNRQEGKWGQQNHAPGTWNEILCEELGEYNEAQLHRKFGGPKADNVRHELVQIAAVAMAMLECWDRNQMSGGTISETGGIPKNIKLTLSEVMRRLYALTDMEGDVENIAELEQFFGVSRD